MKQMLTRFIAGSLGVVMLALIISPQVFAQVGTGEIRGVIKDKSTGEPLVGANILVVGTIRGTSTDFDGAYSIKGLSPGSYKLAVRYVGYQQSQVTVTVVANQTTEVSFDLVQDVLKIDEMLVTGLSGEIPRQQLGSSIAKVAGVDIQNMPVTSVLDALVGKVPGMQVTKSTGTPGTGTYITLRGRKSVTGSSSPIYVVDGVPIDNSYIYDGSGTIQGANRASDIDPNDIESIEVLKGASASAIYGARAANGVILITTKSGKLADPGKFARITYRSSYSSDEAAGTIPLQTTYGQRTPYKPYTPGTTDSYGAALPSGTPTYAHDQDVYRKGNIVENSLDVSGGSQVFRYLLSGTLLNQSGVVKKSDYARQNVRLNLNYLPLKNLGISSNSNYINEKVDLPQDGSNTSGILLGSLRTPPEFDNSKYLEDDGVTQRRFASYDNPLWTMEFNTYKTEVTRFIHRTAADYDLMEGVRLSGSFGWDRYNHFNFRRRAFGSAASPSRLGDINQDRYTNDVINTGVSGTGKYRFTPNIIGTLVVGQELSFFVRNATGAASNNTLPFYDEIGAGISKDASSSRSESRIYSYYAHGMITAWDRITISGGVRRDAGSTFGSLHRVNYYPKASIAYRLSEESFMQDLKDVISEFKLRAAWGKAGRTPGTYDTNNLYTTTGLPDPWGRQTSAGRSNQLGIRQQLAAGNQDVKPELTTELEAGFDAAFWNRRINLEASYFKADISQMLLFVDVPRSTGFNTQLRNGGEMWNQGFEVKLDVNPIRTSGVSWVVGANFARIKNMVTKLEGFSTSYVTITGAFAGTYNIAREGRPLGTWLGYGYEKDANGKIVYSDPADPNRRDNFLNPNIKNAPRFNGTVELGKADPDWTGSLRSDLALFDGDLTISALLDAAHGFQVWNGTRGAMYNFGTHKDTERREELWFNEEGQPVLYQGTTATNFGLSGGRTYQPGEQLRREVWYRVYANGFNVNEPHMEDGSFVKLREIAVSYRLRNLGFLNVESIVLTFSARNLKTWTKYTGYDPEVNTFQQAEGRGFDYFTLPQVRSFRFGISINY